DGNAKLYNPLTKKWTWPDCGGAEWQTASLMPNGQVLLTGGFNGSVSSSAGLYDPATDTWTATGSMTTNRCNHTATLLSNGRVLVVGGFGKNQSSVLSSSELYDPSAEMWTATTSLNTQRYGHTASFLADGKVLVTGGY